MANDFKPFATGPGANVTPQADWEALPALLAGFMSGKASAAQINKALRQASFIAAALAQYTADKSGEDVLDDGDIAGFIAKMSAAFGEDFQPKNEKLTAFSSLAGAANRLPYFTGANALALTALTEFARELLAQNDSAGVLTKLGLGSLKYGAPMIGQLIEWPLSQMPHEVWPDCAMEFIPYMAQSFDAAKYPLLAELHPTNKLPADMRAEFVRGWDNSRGVDAGRALMSSQLSAAPDIRGTLDAGDFSDPHPPTGAFQQTSSINIGAQGGGNAGIDRSMEFRASLYNAVYGRDSATEVRSRNVAWNFIVRAK